MQSIPGRFFLVDDRVICMCEVRGIPSGYANSVNAPQYWLRTLRNICLTEDSSKQPRIVTLLRLRSQNTATMLICCAIAVRRNSLFFWATSTRLPRGRNSQHHTILTEGMMSTSRSRCYMPRHDLALSQSWKFPKGRMRRVAIATSDRLDLFPGWN